VHGEKLHKQKTQPELRHRYARYRNDHGGVVLPLASVHRCIGSKENTKQNRPRETCQREVQSWGKTQGDLLRDRELTADALAQIAPEQATHIGQVLFRERLVQTEFGADPVDRGLVRVGARHDSGGIPGQKMHKQEDQNRDHQQDWKDGQAPSKKIFQHKLLYDLRILDGECAISHRVDTCDVLGFGGDKGIYEEVAPGRFLPDIILEFHIRVASDLGISGS